MIVTSKDVNIPLLPSTTPRAVGIHVSGIIRAIAKHTGILKPENAEDIKEPSIADIREITDPIALVRIAIGLAWEDYYLKYLGQRSIKKHPGETCVDRIYMNPDGVGVSKEWLELENKPYPGVMITRIHEVKATYKSIKTVGDMTKQWLWMTQIKAYCKGYGTRYATMHVLFLCGDYKFPIRPIVREWPIEFTQKEINDNWDMLREYRDYREG
jgi:hypothetical protein